MASALTVLLLGCWLAGHSGVWGEPSYPKPNISGIPSEGVSLGKSVSIWCKGQHQAVQFMLNKDGRHIQSVDANSQALFLINIVSQEQGGNYSCSYRSKSEPFNVSYPSDPVELVVRDPNLPRPNISLSPTGVPAPGADVTIRCEGQRRDVRFFLHKAGDLNLQSLGGAVAIWCRGQRRGVRFVLNKEGRNFRPVDSDESEVVFPISNVSWEDGGSYSCSYHSRSEPFNVSHPSDPVELVVRDPSLPRPSISLPHPQRGEPFVSSQPSDPVQLVVAAAPLDFTNTNITRLVLSAAVLLVLGLILAEAYYSRLRGAPRSLDPALQGRDSPWGTSGFLMGCGDAGANALPPNTPVSENPPTKQLPS
ncbi:immunoglobulin superfamily member 1-like [Mauremys mutica]|uniref:immunoglobulin superfamily member 1-like n=1 Tax=Mauremys mutica TaxID=74926 RepID=UPI001D1682EF|nr:immunoglobulin superfamily member 1-like [Mauremys mutica]